MPINAYAAMQANQSLEPFTYEPKDLGDYEVKVKISHCGICHSDLHLIDNDWRMSDYPLVPGHEIIGEVVALGDHAHPDLLGKRVGIGWQRSACQKCDYCRRGEHNVCYTQEATCVGHYGGYAERIHIDSRFAFPIPDALPSQTAAPLLCAGITVFAPLRRWGVDSSKRVGIIGIGGLGHLAVQFANRLGCEVTAFSSSEAKADEAKELGAHQFVNSRDTSVLKPLRDEFDFILSTVSANLDWGEYIKLLRPNGVLCLVGVPSEPLQVPVGQILSQQRAVTASSIGGGVRMREMLDFASRHNITAWTETLPFDSVNTALDRLRQNDVRYRFVLEQ